MCRDRDTDRQAQCRGRLPSAPAHKERDTTDCAELDWRKAMRSSKVGWVFVMQGCDAKRFPTRTQRHGQSLLCRRIFALPEDLLTCDGSIDKRPRRLLKLASLVNHL